MSLVVDRIKAVEESDEAGSDDIYLITFRGRTKPPFDSGLSSIGPANFWDDFDSGEKENTDHAVAKSFEDAVYAVMMVENDAGKDITGDEVVSAWKAQTALTWKSIMMSFATADLETTSQKAKDAGFEGIKNAMKGLASVYMEFPFGDDDVIAVKRVNVLKKGESETIRFASKAENARYDVTFKVT